MFDNNQPILWNKTKIAEELLKIKAEFQMRKSKFIKYVPTEKELKDAMRLYMLIQDLVKEKDPNGAGLMEILNSTSSVPEEQIKFTGFMDELFRNYPAGNVPHKDLMDIAEKWDVLNYIVEDIVTILNKKMKALKD